MQSYAELSSLWLGFLLLLPPVRTAIKATIKAQIGTAAGMDAPPENPMHPPATNVIEGEFEKVDDSDDTTS